jgi:hypothetical protein
MHKVLAISASIRALAAEEIVRRVVVFGCALALIRPF